MLTGGSAPLADATGNASLKHSQGVLDIGSNTVRLVIYAGEGRAPVPVFNERFACGLGRALARSDSIDEEAMGRVLDILRRWGDLVSRMSLAGLRVVATAAVRESRNAGRFIALARGALGGAEVEVISGEEEARRSALGVLFAIPDADGLVADLGGGSLELALVSGGVVGSTASLPLGVLRVANLSDGDPKRAAKIAGSRLREVGWLRASCAGRPLYVVGGLWRNLLAVHMLDADYPLDVLQGYRMAADEMRALCKRVQALSPEQFAGYRRVSPERVPFLHMGAQILKKIVRRSGAGCVVVSTYGLREGTLLGALPVRVRDADPLIQGATDMCRRFQSSPDCGAEVARWSECLLHGSDARERPRLRRLHLAACLLSETVLHVHPDHRADVLLREILYSQLCGLTHAERVFVAHAGFSRHNGSMDNGLASRSAGLLPEGWLKHAESLGKAMRLAHTIGADIDGVVGETELARSGDTLELRFARHLAHLRGPMVHKCMGRLAQSLGLQPRIRPE